MLTGKAFADPLEMPFSRRGSYICFAAKKYLDTMKHGLYYIHNPYTGEMEYRHAGLKFFGEEELFNSGWMAGCYIFFAEHYGD